MVGNDIQYVPGSPVKSVDRDRAPAEQLRLELDRLSSCELSHAVRVRTATQLLPGRPRRGGSRCRCLPVHNCQTASSSRRRPSPPCPILWAAARARAAGRLRGRVSDYRV